MASPSFTFKLHPTLEINSTPTLIFGSQLTCLIDSLIISSQVNRPMAASFWIAREVEKGVETNFMLDRHLALSPFERRNVLQDTPLTLEPGDLVYAMSDYSDHAFNTFVSYRELAKTDQELTNTAEMKKPVKVGKGRGS